MARVRYYWQRHATFYSDLFPYRERAEFQASRDRELAQFRDIDSGAGRELAIPSPAGRTGSDKGTLNLSYNHLHIDYHDFRNDFGQVLNPGTRGRPSRSYMLRRQRHSVLYFLVVLNDHPPLRLKCPGGES